MSKKGGLTLEQAISSLSKKFPDAVRTMPDVEYTAMPRIPTGVFTFDMLTGGGVPIWKTSTFHGKPSSGKTTMGLRVINGFLNTFKEHKVIYLDFENSFDKSWAANFIDKANVRRLIVVRPQYGEEGVDMARELFVAEDAGLIFLDSIAMMIPTADADKSALEDTMASLPKLVWKFIRKITPILVGKRRDGNPAAVLLINQVAANIGARAFQSQTKTPGGYGASHLNVLDVQFYTKGIDSAKGVPQTVTHQFTIQKAKTTGILAKRSGEYTMCLVDCNKGKAGKLLELDQVLLYAKRIGIVAKDGAKWKVEGKLYNNLEEVEALLSTNENVFNTVKEKTLIACYKDVWATSGGE